MVRNYNQLLNESRKVKRMLKEAYGDDMSPMDNGQMGKPNAQGGQQMMQKPMQQQMGQEQMMPEGEEGGEMEDVQHDNVIDQIRQLAIKGIAQYADDIESEQYQSLKKIWLLTDKFYEGLEGEEGNNGKK